APLAEQRYELASSRLIELHSVPSRPGPNCRISKFARTNQRVSERLTTFSRCQTIGNFRDGSKQSLHRTALPPRPEKAHFGTSKKRPLAPRGRAGGREEDMTDQGFGRRDFLKTTIAGGAAAAATTTAIPASSTQAQQPAAQRAAEGYEFLNLDEAAFVEALVNHMVPADELTPKGTEIGINIYIDRALSGAWGKGERLYMQGPWQVGLPSQGYQLPLTPAQL